MSVVYKDIDLTELKQYTNKLDPYTPLELAIINFYRYTVTNNYNMLDKINEYIARWLTKEKVKPVGYAEVMIFFSDRKYNNVINTFISKLEYIIFKNIDPYFKDIVYDSVVSSTDKLIVRFKIIY